MSSIDLAGLTLAQAQAEQRRRSLLRYVVAACAGYEAGWFHAALCKRLEHWVADCIAKRSPRLIVMAPPRVGKSQITSRSLAPWMLGKFPDQEIILSSYGQDLANDMSRDARSIARSDMHAATFPDFAISDDREAVQQWLTSKGGGLKAVGVGAAITGRGGHLLIDDPVKGAAEAASLLYREAQWRWYTGNARTRVPPGGGVLITLTRWHEDDIVGRLLKQAADDPEADQWDVICFPAIATSDEEHRKEGEALHPERWPLSALHKIRAGMSPYQWASLYQQAPVPDGGGRIKADWLKQTFRIVPAEADRPIHSWDTAIKAGEMNDYTVCHVAQTHEQRVYLTDVLRRRMEFPELLAAVKSLAMRDNPRAVLIEDKGSGQQLIQMLKRDPSWRWSIIPVTPKVDKITRMDAVTPWLESGRVWIPDAAPWLVEWMTELLGFPVAAHDDQIDSLSQLLDYLDNKGGGLSAYRELANRLASNSPNGVALARGFAPSPWRR